MAGKYSDYCISGINEPIRKYSKKVETKMEGEGGIITLGGEGFSPSSTFLFEVMRASPPVHLEIDPSALAKLSSSPSSITWKFELWSLKHFVCDLITRPTLLLLLNNLLLGGFFSKAVSQLLDMLNSGKEPERIVLDLDREEDIDILEGRWTHALIQSLCALVDYLEIPLEKLTDFSEPKCFYRMKSDKQIVELVNEAFAERQAFVVQYVKEKLLSVYDGSTFKEKPVHATDSLFDPNDPDFERLRQNIKDIVVSSDDEDAVEKRDFLWLPKETHHIFGEERLERECVSSMILDLADRHGVPKIFSKFYGVSQALFDSELVDKEEIMFPEDLERDVITLGGEDFSLSSTFLFEVMRASPPVLIKIDPSALARLSSSPSGVNRKFELWSPRLLECGVIARPSLLLLLNNLLLGGSFSKAVSQLLDILNRGILPTMWVLDFDRDEDIDILEGHWTHALVQTLCALVDYLEIPPENLANFSDPKRFYHMDIDERIVESVNKAIAKCQTFIVQYVKEKLLLINDSSTLDEKPVGITDSFFDPNDFDFECLRQNIKDIVDPRDHEDAVGRREFIWLPKETRLIFGKELPTRVCVSDMYLDLADRYGVPKLYKRVKRSKLSALLFSQSVGNKEIRLPEAQKTEVLVSILGDDIDLGNKLLKMCQDANLTADLMVHKTLMKHFKKAYKCGILWMVIVGEREIKNGVVTLNNKEANIRLEVEHKDLVNKLKNLMKEHPRSS